ncbi:hypothetical protein M8C21_010240, partial [Ambrosia artemisiifolia]
QQLALVVSSKTMTSYKGLLESQKQLISKQICDLQNIVSRQCKLTGVNPVSLETAVVVAFAEFELMKSHRSGHGMERGVADLDVERQHGLFTSIDSDADEKLSHSELTS